MTTTKIKAIVWYGGGPEILTWHVYCVIIIDEEKCKVFIHPTNVNALTRKIMG
jgi:hypothetical protein